MKILLKLFLSLVVILLSIKGFSQSGNSITITPEIEAQSNAFKSLTGKDRLAQFKTLQKNIIVNDGARHQTIEMGLGYSTKPSIASLLGTPDKISEGGFWEYLLKNNASSCKVVFGFDKAAQVIFYTIKGCE